MWQPAAADRYCAARHGFDDKLIYDEISAEPKRRKIPTVCMEISDREEPFICWDKKEDKICY